MSATPRTLVDAIRAILQLEERMDAKDIESADIARRVGLVEKQQGHLANRPPFPIPPFPDVLRDIGLPSPKAKAAR